MIVVCEEMFCIFYKPLKNSQVLSANHGCTLVQAVVTVIVTVGFDRNRAFYGQPPIKNAETECHQIFAQAFFTLVSLIYVQIS